MPFNFNLAADGSRHAISIRGKNIVATRTTDNILSLAVLLKTGYKVKFRVSRSLTPLMVVTCTCQRVSALLVFSGNLWRLPTWSSPQRSESTAGIPAHQNPFAALLNVPENVACTRAASQPSEVSPLELSVADQIRLCHDRNRHPSYNTDTRENVKRVLLHLARAPIVQVNACRTRAITQSPNKNPRSF